MPPGRAKPRADHELAQQLDLARREQGLTPRDLAEKLCCDPRSVRRYLSGERRPSRDIVELWEQTCGMQPGTLTGPYDGAPAASQEPAEHRSTSRRSQQLILGAAGAAVLLVAVALFLLLRPSSEDNPVTRHAPSTSDIQHHFNADYTGQVWFRVHPAPGHGNQDHRVTLRWGPIQTTLTLRRPGANSRPFLLEKNDPKDVTFLVKVDPPARVDIGEGDPPGDAQNLPSRWTDRTSG